MNQSHLFCLFSAASGKGGKQRFSTENLSIFLSLKSVLQKQNLVIKILNLHGVKLIFKLKVRIEQMKSSARGSQCCAAYPAS